MPARPPTSLFPPRAALARPLGPPSAGTGTRGVARLAGSSSAGGAGAGAGAGGGGTTGRRGVKDFVSGQIPSGATVRYPLASKNILGVHQSRGTRLTLEDAFSFGSLALPPSLLRASLRASHAAPHSLSSWEGDVRPGGARGWEGKATHAGEVLAVGVYDGHGGQSVSRWLAESLARELEKGFALEEGEASPDGKLDDRQARRTWEEIVEVVDFFRSLGGYFRRWEGGLLAARYRQSTSGPPTPLTLPERLTLSFLKADKHVLQNVPDSQVCGSTASVLLLHSLSTGASLPFFSSPLLSLTIAHVGDTRVLLTSTTGQTEALTESHHADARVELARLRRLAGRTGSVVDAFGETRWMGAVENTRAVGDGRWKRDGVSAEPQISSRVIDGNASAYLTLVTDGVSSQMSDLEISDLALTAPTPSSAARSIVSFAEDIGGSDNCSAVVVPLAGWTRRTGVDGTRERREWRRKEVEGMSSKLVRR